MYDTVCIEVRCSPFFFLIYGGMRMQYGGVVAP